MTGGESFLEKAQNLIQQTVTNDENEELVKVSTEVEIKDTSSSMGSLKAPRPHSLPLFSLSTIGV